MAVARRRGGLAAVAAAGGLVWLLAVIVRPGPDADALGATPAARVAALRRALPLGTPLDSARRFLYARRLSFAQEPGGALRAALPGGAALPPAALVLEFDARRRLAARRLTPAGPR
jgi:hypothetical protein